MKETDYKSLQKKYQEELDRGYLARRKGGIAWRQHCAALKNLERKLDIALRKAATDHTVRLHNECA